VAYGLDGLNEAARGIWMKALLVIVLAIGMTLVIATGGVDLSVGAVMALAAATAVVRSFIRSSVVLEWEPGRGPARNASTAAPNGTIRLFDE